MSIQSIKQWLKQKDGVHQFYKPALMSGTLIRIEDDEPFTVLEPMLCTVAAIDSCGEDYDYFIITRAHDNCVHVYYRLFASDGDDEDGWNGSGREGWCEINHIITNSDGLFHGFDKQHKI